MKSWLHIFAIFDFHEKRFLKIRKSYYINELENLIDLNHRSIALKIEVRHQILDQIINLVKRTKH